VIAAKDSGSQERLSGRAVNIKASTAEKEEKSSFFPILGEES
jgi:hypothetical protein